MNSRYGWIRGLPDHRDYVFEPQPAAVGASPKEYDPHSGCPPIYDQGHCGCCTGDATVAGFAFAERREALPASEPSGLFICYNARTVEGTNRSDSGGRIGDGIRFLHSEGICSEAKWPYVLR